MAEEQDIKQETVEETEDTTNVEEPTVEKTEEAVADAAQVLEELKADFDNRYKRLQADFENFKRRTNQEKEQLAGYVKGDVLTDLLPVLDNFERAVQSPAEGEAKVFLDGFIMIHQNLMAMLSKHGLAVIEAAKATIDFITDDKENREAYKAKLINSPVFSLPDAMCHPATFVDETLADRVEAIMLTHPIYDEAIIAEYD